MSDQSRLQHEKSVLERESTSILEMIRELRHRARAKSIEASATRIPLPETEIAHWQKGIKEQQAKLMEAQAKLGAVNKLIREAKADHRPIRTLSQLPSTAVSSEPPSREEPSHSGSVIRPPGDIKEDHLLFLQFFRQLVTENVDPRLVEVLERDAHGLVDEYRRSHKEEKLKT